MKVENCKSYGSKCPCVECENKKCPSWNDGRYCDTSKMCEKAREYCESLHKVEVGGMNAS